MNILIADDHIVVRKGLIQIISDEFPNAIFDEAINGKEAMELLRSKKYDIAILDITMPELTGMDVVRQMKIEENKTPILVLTSHPEGQYAIRVLKAGASGFIGKEMAGEELTIAIHKILSGRKYITQTLAEKIAGDMSNDSNKAQHELLSDREFEVMKLIANGKTVSEIADKLFISVTTVSTYRTRVLDKLNLKNNSELMHYAMTQNLV